LCEHWTLLWIVNNESEYVDNRSNLTRHNKDNLNQIEVKTEFNELVNGFSSNIAPTAGMLSEQLITEITALSGEQKGHVTITHKSNKAGNCFQNKST